VAADARKTLIRSLSYSLAGITLATLSVFSQVRVGSRELNGWVADRTGAGIADATIVASGVGFRGWTSTGPDGSFHLEAAGSFISIRHPGLKARLLRTSELIEPLQIRLEPADESVRTMPACSSPAAGGKQWIGGGLKVNPGHNRFKGPVNGEHDSHWYVTFGKDTLHIVDGFAWHAGLPSEDRLASSESISVHSWEFGGVVGLDLAGRTKNGMRWRWVGAPFADAVEYGGTTPESAEYFDRIIETTCFGSATPTTK
jgi:hypothetical protein